MAHTQTADVTRRDFLHVATASAVAVGAAASVWPFIAQMNPSAAVLALSTVEVDIGAIQPGQSVTVLWRGRPTFIRRRTPEEIAASRAVPINDLLDRDARSDIAPAGAVATDEFRAVRPEWLVVVGVCTHLGCIPLNNQGRYGGWLCPCHGSEYDTAGRVRVGPAPENLQVPLYTFLSDTRIRIG